MDRSIPSRAPSWTALWIVGAGHIPGLLLRLLDRGFTLAPVNL